MEDQLNRNFRLVEEIEISNAYTYNNNKQTGGSNLEECTRGSVLKTRVRTRNSAPGLKESHMAQLSVS